MAFSLLAVPLQFDIDKCGPLKKKNLLVCFLAILTFDSHKKKRLTCLDI